MKVDHIQEKPDQNWSGASLPKKALPYSAKRTALRAIREVLGVGYDELLK